MIGLPEGSDTLTTALHYADQGWHVFPALDKKTPLVRWSTEATSNRHQVGAWWTEWPDAWICVATGPSRLFVVDLDGEVGRRNWRSMLIEGPAPSGTLTATTPRGQHEYYLGPGPTTVGRIAPNIDTRGTGGYVVAPGSPGYTWHAPSAPIQYLPGQIHLPEYGRHGNDPDEERRTRPRCDSRRRAPRGVGNRYLAAALAGEVKRVAAARPGCRNNTLVRAAGNIGQLIGDEDDRRHARGALMRAATDVGLGRAEAERTINSGFAWGQRNPRDARRAP